MSFYQRLHAETEYERNELLKVGIIQDALGGQLRLPQYVAFLTQAYHHVKHTVPLLMACGGRLPSRLNWLRDAIAEYIKEECGHDEWILSDINACGVDATRVRLGKPGVEAEVMVAYAYHQIDRVNPVGFFGMVHVLEGTSQAVASNAAAAMQRALQLPEKAFTYLVSHGSLDVEHGRFFESLMNRLEASDDQSAVIHCARSFYRLYGAVFRSLPPYDRTAVANGH
jgi:pyrroloquinoline quinone (PQQ) biosynthesis protein C